MGNYQPLYILRIEHNYFDENVCRAIRCYISPSVMNLWLRSALLFRQISMNEWAILYDSEYTSVDTHSDLLLLEMEITDSTFMLYTQWNGFHPNSAYALELSPTEDVVDAVQVVTEIGSKRTTGSGFCQIRLKVTDDIYLAARDGKPKTCTLKFHALEYRWEYLFILRKDETLSPDRFLLEEEKGRLHFKPFESVMEYGYNVLRTVSEEVVPLRERYDYRLALVSPTGNAGQKQIVQRHINLPELGRFFSAETALLRQVCYI